MATPTSNGVSGSQNSNVKANVSLSLSIYPKSISLTVYDRKWPLCKIMPTPWVAGGLGHRTVVSQAMSVSLSIYPQSIEPIYCTYALTVYDRKWPLCKITSTPRVAGGPGHRTVVSQAIAQNAAHLHPALQPILWLNLRNSSLGIIDLKFKLNLQTFLTPSYHRSK